MIVDRVFDRDVLSLRGVSLTEDGVLVWRGGSALLAGVLSSCFAKKKVAKEEGDPRLRGRLCRLPCATRDWRALRNSGLRPSNSPRAFSASPCVARRSTWGPGKASRNNCSAQKKMGVFDGRPQDFAKTRSHRFSVDASPTPLGGAEQRRSAGGFRRALFEGQSPELRSRPAFRVAQGTSAAGTDPGSPSFWLLFLGEARKSNSRRQRETPRQN
jgi:hypothetical protein